MTIRVPDLSAGSTPDGTEGVVVVQGGAVVLVPLSDAVGYNDNATAPGVVTATSVVAKAKGVVVKSIAPADANFAGVQNYFNTTNNAGTATALDFATGRPGKKLVYIDDTARTIGTTYWYYQASVNSQGIESATRTLIGSVVYAGVKGTDIDGVLTTNLSDAGSLSRLNTSDINDITAIISTGGTNTISLATKPSFNIKASGAYTVNVSGLGSSSGDRLEVANHCGSTVAISVVAAGVTTILPIGTKGAWVSNGTDFALREVYPLLDNVTFQLQKSTIPNLGGRTFYNDDTAHAPTYGTDGPTIRYGGAITGNHNINLTQGTAQVGQRFRVTRTATGAFNLVVKDAASSTAIYTLSAANQWVDCEWNGTGFEVCAGGSF